MNEFSRLVSTLASILFEVLRELEGGMRLSFNQGANYLVHLLSMQVRHTIFRL
jgi:hypothetical protein